MSKEILLQAGEEASIKAEDFAVELCKIADKYKINRTSFIKANAKVFKKATKKFNFENLKLTLREEENNE